MPKLTKEQKIKIYNESKNQSVLNLSKKYNVDRQVIYNLIRLGNKNGLKAFEKIKNILIKSN
ncbi:hypothetical protein ACW95P_03240 [Candidatus Mycoplasma pogonae]